MKAEKTKIFDQPATAMTNHADRIPAFQANSACEKSRKISNFAPQHLHDQSGRKIQRSQAKALAWCVRISKNT
jgi:hypothetical protein